MSRQGAGLARRAALMVAAAAGLAPGALAQTPAPASPTGTCLVVYQIDHTEIVDRSTILFHMKDGKVWKNTLQAPCVTLPGEGFIYEPKYDEVCDNIEHIRVLRTREVCLLGIFTPVEPKKK